MKKLQRILRPLGIVAGITAILLTLGFVERSAEHAPIQELRIVVAGGEGLHFIDEQIVRTEVLDQGVSVLNAPIGEVDITNIEARLRTIPSVAHAEAYHTMDGVLHVNVVQRRPIVRVFNKDGSTFYIDEEGWTMPTSTRYTARVLVVTGELHESGALNGVHSVFGSDSLEKLGLSDDIHRIASFIIKDPFWSAMIDQVVVNKDREFELIPRVGDQRILIGDGTALQQRFQKLRIFYDQGIPRSDWRRYDRIDLRFADQVVCTKRTTL